MEYYDIKNYIASERCGIMYIIIQDMLFASNDLLSANEYFESICSTLSALEPKNLYPLVYMWLKNDVNVRINDIIKILIDNSEKNRELLADKDFSEAELSHYDNIISKIKNYTIMKKDI